MCNIPTDRTFTFLTDAAIHKQLTTFATVALVCKWLAVVIFQAESLMQRFYRLLIPKQREWFLFPCFVGVHDITGATVNTAIGIMIKIFHICFIIRWVDNVIQN